ncbi:hypothetical protein ES288_A01G000400v1 [Gossypium darwinii]|uniref:Uncharacterized protein n=1 Tax=Gossypium darwinii TaxID=34276 RepID=A0A5D2BGU8_GOSDA|nr:hypothetical protein ES288_D08G000300v1 [Gossypium darwinii]TYH29300.1 hypothetical protein ES288_A01G000400v1 [Gossypium darwinii]
MVSCLSYTIKKSPSLMQRLKGIFIEESISNIFKRRKTHSIEDTDDVGLICNFCTKIYSPKRKYLPHTQSSIKNKLSPRMPGRPAFVNIYMYINRKRASPLSMEIPIIFVVCKGHFLEPVAFFLTLT